MTKKTGQEEDKSFAAFSRMTINEIFKTWNKIKSITRIAVTCKVAPDLPAADEDYIKKQIHECVFAEGGEASSRSRSVELGKVYLELSKEGRQKFMKILAREFDIDKQKVKEIIQEFQSSENEDLRIKAEMELSNALIPPRVKLLKQPLPFIDRISHQIKIFRR